MNEELKKVNPDLVKTLVLKEFEYLDTVAQDIIKNNGSEEVQKYVKDELRVEIESPLESIGGTNAVWIRLQYGGLWIFLYADDDKWEKEDIFELNGKTEYNIDYYGGEYGAEFLITDGNKEDFIKYVKELNPADIEDLLDTMELPAKYKDIKASIKKHISDAEENLLKYVPFSDKSETIEME